MNTGLEGPAVAAWVYDTLASDPTMVELLGGPELAPWRIVEGALAEDQPERVQDTPLPWATFSILDPLDVGVVGLVQVMAMVQVQVRFTVQAASYAPLLAPYARAYELLHGRANVVTPAGTILTAERVSAVQFPERANGLEYRHLGALLRVHVQ